LKQYFEFYIDQHVVNSFICMAITNDAINWFKSHVHTLLISLIENVVEICRKGIFS